VQDLPVDAKRIADIPDDFRPASLGKRADILRKIKEIVPFADFTDPAWGHINGEGFFIEVNLGEDTEVNGFAFHGRGGDLAVGVIADILDHLNLGALDGGNHDNGFFDPERSIESLRKWRAYRDYVVDLSRHQP